MKLSYCFICSYSCLLFISIFVISGCKGVYMVGGYSRGYDWDTLGFPLGHSKGVPFGPQGHSNTGLLKKPLSVPFMKLLLKPRTKLSY